MGLKLTLLSNLPPIRDLPVPTRFVAFFSQTMLLRICCVSPTLRESY